MLGGDWLKREWGFVLFFIGNLIAYGGMVWLDAVHGTLRDGIVPQTIGLYLLAFLFFIGLVVWGEKRPLNMRWVWGAAILFRLLLLFTTPTLSDDVYRYMWDGYVATEGVSPYAFAIDSSQLDYLDIPQRALANNSWMASPYMPVAQWLFWGLALLFPLHPFFFQLLMVVFDLLSGVLIARLLRIVNIPPYRLILYLLNPLVIIEIAHGAHVDAWMIFLFLTAVWFTLSANKYVLINEEQASSDASQSKPLAFKNAHSSFLICVHLSAHQKEMLAPLLMALSTLTKIIPILTLPVFFWRWSWGQRILYGVVTVGLLVPAGLRAGWGLVGELNGTGLFGALRIYADVWQFNSALFKWIARYFEQNGANAPLDAAKRVAFIAILLVLLWVWVRARRVVLEVVLLRLTAVPLIAYLLLTPTVHPWYTLIVVALLPFMTPTRDEASSIGWIVVGAWLYLNATLIFSYLTYRDPNNFGELVWVGQVEWIPTLILLTCYLLLALSSKMGAKS